MSNLKLYSIESWFSELERLSLSFEKYHSFLPEQKELLARIYKKILNEKKNVWVFAAPPSSGKTHVICLLAKVLTESGEKTAIVVPSNYLKEEFYKACLEVVGGLSGTDILNISEYLKTSASYDFVLVDEAHNLKSFLELEEDYVKSVSFSLEDDFAQDLVGRYLLPNQEFIAQQLSFLNAKDLLVNLSRMNKFRARLNPVISNPTVWSCFIYIWRESNLCNVLFVQNDGLCKFNIPSKHLLLFSATQLSTQELKFYCGIDQSAIAEIESIKSLSNFSEKQRFCISMTDKLDLKANCSFSRM